MLQTQVRWYQTENVLVLKKLSTVVFSRKKKTGPLYFSNHILKLEKRAIFRREIDENLFTTNKRKMRRTIELEDD